MSVPSSVIHILSGVPLNNSYEHSLYFATEADQLNYFLYAHKHKTFEKFSYLREEQAIKVAGDIVNARSWNYLMYQNDSGKWYYNFITKVEYLNDNAVKLHLELDVLQTFRWDWDLHECFIERMHTPTDGFGEHTVDEGLELGELVDIHIDEYFFDEYVILMMCTKDGANNSAYSKVYGKVFSGLAIYAIQMKDYRLLGTLLDGDPGACVALWMYPKELVSVTDDWEGMFLHPVTSVTQIKTVKIKDALFPPVEKWFEPNNMKMYSYPFTMLTVSNNMGGCATFKRDLFNKTDNDEFLFHIEGALSPDCGVQLVPESYNTADGSMQNYDHALSLPPFPTCAWDSDVYKVWLAQNQHQADNTMRQANIQAGIGAVTTAVGVGMMAASGGTMGGGSVLGGAGTMLNAYNNVQSLMAQQKDLEVQPPQAKGNHSGNINMSNGRMGFTFCHKALKLEMAYAIDEYFSRYGYKVNRVQVPSLCNRQRFTYVKTQGCFVTGDLGTEDQLKIQAIFDKGITWWADHDSVGVFTGFNECLL